MRTKALHRWRVPQVFAALPLLLQLVLVFFFGGIFQLLIDTNTIVVIPVVCVMGTTILFLVLMTILPTIQAITLNHSGLRINNDVPVPCPYKSLQAQVFWRFVMSLKTLFSAMLLFFVAVYWVIFCLLLIPGQLGSLSYSAKAIQVVCDAFKRVSGYVSILIGTFLHWTSPLLGIGCLKEKHRFDYMRPHIFSYWHQQSWLEFNLAWMSVHDNYFKSICTPDTWLFLN